MFPVDREAGSLAVVLAEHLTGQGVGNGLGKGEGGGGEVLHVSLRFFHLIKRRA